MTMRIFTITMGVMLSLCLLSCDRSATPEAKAFAKAIADADRLVMVHNADGSGHLVPVETGREIYRAMRSHTGMEEGFSCLCYADLVLVWYTGERVLCAIGLQPDGMLSWPNGPVQGDMRLSEEAAQDLHAQLQAVFDGSPSIPGYEPPNL
jgi:hypothetical protein